MGLLVAGIIFAVGCIVVAYVYFQARIARVSSIRDDLERDARLAAAYIDGNKHKQLVDPQQEGSFLHSLLLDPMVDFHNATDDIVRVYTLVAREEGGYYIVLDTSQKPEALKHHPHEQQKARIMEPYAGNFEEGERDEIMRMHTGDSYSTAKPYTDRFGTFMSGFAPVVDSEGNMVALVGVDLPVEIYRERMAQVRSVAVHGILFSLLLSAIIGGVTAWIQRLLLKAEAVKNQARRHSLQSMEELEYNQKLLKSIAEMNRIILSEPDLSESVNEALRLVGKTAGVDRAYLMKHDEMDGLTAVESYEWTRSGISSHLDDPFFQSFSYDGNGLMSWHKRFAEGRDVLISTSDANAQEIEFLSRYDIKSIFCCPILFEQTCWGFMVLEDCQGERFWTEEQRAIIAASARNLGAAIKRRQEEKARRVADERFRAIFQLSPIGMLVNAVDGGVQQANEAFLKILGYKFEEIGSCSYRDFIAPDRISELEHERSRLSSDGYFGPIQTEYIHRDGHRVSVLEQGILIEAREGEKQVVSIIQDITQRLEHEKQMRKALADADAANRAKSEFLATMSHEIRTPMNGVVGMTGLLLESDLTAQQRDYVETIQLSGESLLAIISDILDFSKIEAGRMDFEQSPFSLRDCIESTLELLGPKAAEKGLRMGYRIADRMPETYLGDATRIRQVLFNLVGNAIKFTEEGEVFITVNSHTKSAGGDDISIDVHDTGIGIPPHQIGRLFKSFSQLDTSSTRRHGGTGLGLVISQKLLERMGGRIWVDSVVEQGTVFHVTLPLLRATTQLADADSLMAKKLQGKKAMVIENNKLTREYYVRQLQTLGMEVESFSSAHECLAWSKLNDGMDIALIAQDLKNYGSCRLALDLGRIYKGRLSLVLLRSNNNRLTSNYSEAFELALSPTYRLTTLTKYLADALKLTVRLPAPKVPEVNTDGSANGDSEDMKLSILMAEDNKVNQKVTSLLLKKMGYTAEIANNGLEVLAAMRKRSYDVILMDMHMPEMDGLEATRNIRESFSREAQPYIIALTASAFQDFKQECHDAGVNAFLTKPLRSEELKKYLAKIEGLRTGQETEDEAPS